MSKYTLNERSTCITIVSPADEIPSWTSLLDGRYGNHLNRVDGLTVEKKDDNGKKTSFTIINHSAKRPKKPVLTLTLYSTGTIMAHAQETALTIWKKLEIENLFKAKEGGLKPRDSLESFIESLQIDNSVVPLPENIPLPKDDSDSESEINVDTNETEQKSELEASSSDNYSQEKQLNQILDRLSNLEGENKNLKTTISQLTSDLSENVIEILTLKNDNKALCDSINQLRSSKNQTSQPVCHETDKSELQNKIKVLEKKLGELKSTVSDLNKDHRELHQQYLNFLENYNDGMFCEKTGERLSQKKISTMQQDVLVAHDTVQKLQTNFDALKNKMNDKLNHVTQLVKTATVPSPQINPDTPISACSKTADEQINLEKTSTPREIGYATGDTGHSQHSDAVSVVKPRDAS